MYNGVTVSYWAQAGNHLRDTRCPPPEIIQKKPCNEKVDHWALGILIYEFLDGKPPFESPRMQVTYRLICHDSVRFPPRVLVEA